MNKISNKRSFIAAVLCLFFLFALPPGYALESGCRNAADRWILDLGDEKNTETYQRHTQSDCEWAGKWVKKYELDTDQPRRERMCNDLVLIWSYKNCGFFRDVLNPDAYPSCKAWSREMFQHCMDNDVDWFPWQRGEAALK